jgi:hypothetical protein
MSHDQNFKNLIVDYPCQSIGFFAAAEAQAVDAGVRVLPIREEQLKERLGERFRELDVPLLVEWPDGRRAALLFVLEEETDPSRFSIHRLAHYCLDLAELYATDRVVPVVIFLHPGGFPTCLRLGSDTRTYISISAISPAPSNRFRRATICTAPTSSLASTCPTWPMPRTTNCWSTPRRSAA